MSFVQSSYRVELLLVGHGGLVPRLAQRRLQLLLPTLQIPHLIVSEGTDGKKTAHPRSDIPIKLDARRHPSNTNAEMLFPVHL